MAQVLIYSANPCPYCVLAKQLLKTAGIPFEERDITNDDAKWEELACITNGWRTVPMIFVGSTFIGGHIELQKLKSEGKLHTMVQG